MELDDLILPYLGPAEKVFAYLLYHSSTMTTNQRKMGAKTFFNLNTDTCAFTTRSNWFYHTIVRFNHFKKKKKKKERKKERKKEGERGCNMQLHSI